MTIHSANSLSMPEILEQLKQSSNRIDDKSLIELVCRYLKTHKQDCTPFDARRWIEIMVNSPENNKPDKAKFKLIKNYETIKHPSLVFHLKQEKIPFHLANKFLIEIKAYDSLQKKHFAALAFSNEKDGYSIVNSKITDWIGEPSLSFIRGKAQKSNTLHIIYNFWDYLSLLAYIKKDDFPDDAIILNSYECLSQVKAYIYQHSYRKAYSWLSNDMSGRKARHKLSAILQQENNLVHIAMNAMYRPQSSFSEWHKHQINTNK